MLGYEADETSTVTSWQNLLFHTGDLARQDGEGFIYIEGRVKDMIRRSGENISAWEVEALILQHPQIAEVAVVGVPNARGDDEEVKAIVVLEDGQNMSPSAIHAFCCANMARFMVPSFIELRASLPRTDVGKVEKAALTGIAPPVWAAGSC